MSEEKVFIGSGFVFDTQYGPMPKGEICIQDFLAFVNSPENKKFIRNYQNLEAGIDKDYVKFEMVNVKEPRNEYNTHAIKIDKYLKETVVDTATPPATSGDLPF